MSYDAILDWRVAFVKRPLLKGEARPGDHQYAGLLMRSFVALREVHLGFRADHVFRTVLPLPMERYKTAEQVAGFFRPLLARLKALPGVVDAAASSSLPLLAVPQAR